MARGLFMLVCLLPALAVQLSAQPASATRTEETDPAPESWRKAMLDQLSGIKHDLAEGRCSSGGSLGAVVAQLVAGQTAMQNAIAASSSSLSSMKEDFQKMKFRLKKTEEELQAFKALGQKTDQGSTFVRWGRTTCPANATLVYSGVAAGKLYSEKGSGTNTLCLTSSPQFDNTNVPSYYAHLYGAEYEYIPGHHDNDVPCSVCRAPQSTTIMMAATLTCPQGWTAQYTGHLISQWHAHFATEYVCLDGKPEHDSAGIANSNGHVMYYVVTVCGTLPCPPYINHTVVTCVVCSK